MAAGCVSTTKKRESAGGDGKWGFYEVGCGMRGMLKTKWSVETWTRGLQGSMGFGFPRSADWGPSYSSK